MKDLKRAIQIVYMLCSDNTDLLSEKDKRWFFLEFLKNSELTAPTNEEEPHPKKEEVDAQVFVKTKPNKSYPVKITLSSPQDSTKKGEK